MIPYSRQNIDLQDIKSVVNVLKSDWLTQGPSVQNFENKIKKYTGAKFSCAVNSATSALHVACMALKVQKGDIVWTSPNTFVSSANVALLCGAKIDFVDIDPSTYNISVTELEKKLIKAKKSNKLPKIIIPVHFGGQPTDQKEIWKLSKKYKFKIIEDASHSLGAKHLNERVGSCKWSDVVVLSFHAVKVITTGEGGMALTNNKNIYNQILKLRSHGITRDKKFLKNKHIGDWYYEQHILGFNYRMTDIQAALGISQLKRINKFRLKREKLAKMYNKLLKGLPFYLPKIKKENISSWHLYVIKINFNKTKKNYKFIFEFMRKNGIYVNLHYLPVHLHPYYIKLGFGKNDFPQAEKYSKEALTLPLHTQLRISEIKKIVAVLKQALL